MGSGHTFRRWLDRPNHTNPTHLSSQGLRIRAWKRVQGLLLIKGLVERPGGLGQEEKAAAPQGAPSPAATKSPAPGALRRPPLRIPGAAGAPRA